MEWELLKTDYVDAVFEGLRKYQQIINADGTYSFADVTAYLVKEDSFIGAKDINAMNVAMNLIMAALNNGTNLYDVFTQFFADQQVLFEKTASDYNGGFEEYLANLRKIVEADCKQLEEDYTKEITDFKDTQESMFNLWYQGVKDQCTQLQKDYVDDITKFEEIQETAFNMWFEFMKDQLSKDAAGNLQMQIGNLNELETGDKDSLVSAVNEVQQDVDSLKKSVSDGKQLVADAITETGIETAADATYQEMADNISEILAGDVKSENVLEGKTYSSAEGRNLAGSMTDNSKKDIIISETKEEKNVVKRHMSGFGGNMSLFTQGLSETNKIFRVSLYVNDEHIGDKDIIYDESKNGNYNGILGGLDLKFPENYDYTSAGLLKLKGFFPESSDNLYFSFGVRYFNARVDFFGSIEDSYSVELGGIGGVDIDSNNPEATVEIPPFFDNKTYQKYLIDYFNVNLPDTGYYTTDNPIHIRKDRIAYSYKIPRTINIRSYSTTHAFTLFPILNNTHFSASFNKAANGRVEVYLIDSEDVQTAAIYSRVNNTATNPLNITDANCTFDGELSDYAFLRIDGYSSAASTNVNLGILSLSFYNE